MSAALRGLALEAATGQFSLAACNGARVQALELQPAREHTPRVYEHTEALLRAVGTDFAELDFVAFGCGPGSFTGVRVVAAAAQAIAFAHSLPVCRVSSMAVLATSAARMLGPGLYGICQDARMGRVYAALYDAGEVLQPLLADTLADPLNLTLAGEVDFVALGDAWASVPVLMERHRRRIRAVEPGIFPLARDLLVMGEAAFRGRRTVAPHEALPEYLGQMPAKASTGKASTGKASTATEVR